MSNTAKIAGGIISRPDATLIHRADSPTGIRSPQKSMSSFPVAPTGGSAKITIRKLNLWNSDPGKDSLPGTGNEETGTNSDGTDLSSADLSALNGIEFLIEYYQFDFRTCDYVAQTSPWANPMISDAAFGTAVSADKTIYGYRKKTDGGGVLEFDNLAFGIYLIYEIDSSSSICRGDPIVVDVPRILPATDNLQK